MSQDERLQNLLDRWEELREAGQCVPAEVICQDCPELASLLRERIVALQKMGWVSELASGPVPATGQKEVRLVPDNEPVPGYRLVECLGKGGFGEVWKARGPGGFSVAMKFVPLGERAAAVELRAIEVIKEARHPCLLTTFAAWRTGEFLAIATELADRTLLDRLREAQRDGISGIPREELLGYIAQAAQGLDYLAGHRIQHRDIKPTNLLLMGGYLKLGDFGLARLLQHSVTAHSGSLTVAYAPPEFFEGKATVQSDQYSLAATYCQLRGGKLPFEGTTAQIIAGHLHRAPDLTTVPEQERPVLAKALAKRPDERWPTCEAFVAALASAQTEPIPAAPTTPWETPVKPQRGSQWLALAGVAVAALVVVLAFAWWPRDRGSPRPPYEGQPLADSTKRVLVATDTDKPSPHTSAEPTQTHSFVFDGRSRIVTPLERFAPCTLEAWVRPDAAPLGRPEKYFIGSDIPGRSGIGIGCAYHDRQSAPIFGVQILPAPTYRDVPTTQPIPLSQWSHVAAVYNKRETVAYLNGREVARGAPSANMGGTPFVVGNAGKDNMEHYFVGQIRSIRISRGTRYEKEFTPPVMLVPDTIAVLVLDASRTENGKATDLSGNGNHSDVYGVTVLRP